MNQHESLKQLNKNALQSKKFKFGLIALGLNALILAGALLTASVIYQSKPEALDWFAFGGFTAMGLGAMNVLPLGYVGTTNWQEKAVRVAAIGKGLKEQDDER